MVELTARVLQLFEARMAEAVSLTEEQVKAIIAEELGEDTDAGRLYNAIKALEEEFRGSGYHGRQATLLETKVAEMEGKVETAAQDAKKAKTFSIIGIILGVVGIALGLGS